MYKDINFVLQMLGKADTMFRYCLKKGYKVEANEHLYNLEDIYDRLSESDKPEWLTWDQILEYKKELVG